PVVAAAAGVLALFVMGGTAIVAARIRSLELEVKPRAVACAGAAGMGLLIALLPVLTGVASVEGAAALGGAMAAASIVRLARAENPLKLARQARRAATLALFGGPVVALASIAIEGRMSDGAAVAIALAGVALAIGAFAQKLEEPFLPVRGIL